MSASAVNLADIEARLAKAHARVYTLSAELRNSQVVTLNDIQELERRIARDQARLVELRQQLALGDAATIQDKLNATWDEIYSLQAEKDEVAQVVAKETSIRQLLELQAQLEREISNA